MTEHDSELSRLYRQAAVETPSAALDAAILKAARDKLAKPVRPVRSRWTHWMTSAGLVATLVLGVYVTLLVEREHPITEELAPERTESRPPVAARADGPVPGPASASRAAPSASPVAAARPAAQPGLIEDKALAARSPAAAETGEALAPAPAAPAAIMRSPTMPQTPEARLEEIRRLKREGRDQEVVTRLAAFRKDFPDYPVPKDLAP